MVTNNYFNFFFEIIFILLFFSGGTLIFAQAEQVDDLLARSQSKYSSQNFFQALDFAYEATKIAEASEVSKYKAQSYYQFARSLAALEFFKISIVYVQKAMDESYYRANPIFQAELHNLVAYNFAHINAPGYFLDEMDQALKILDSTQSSIEKFKLQAESYSKIGFFYKVMNKSDSLFKYLRLEENLYDSIPKYAVAEELADFLLLKGYANLEYKKIDSVPDYFLESLELKSATNDSICYKQYFALGEYYFNIGAHEKSMDYYQQAKENLSRNGKIDMLSVNIYKAIARCYDSLGNLESAQLYRSRYRRLHESIRIEKLKDYSRVVQKLQTGAVEYENVDINRILVIICTTILILSAIYIHFYRKWRSLNLMKNIREAEANVLKLRINSAFKEVVQLAKRNDSHFLKRFEEVYIDFSKALKQEHPDLTKSEKIFSAMLFLNFSTKEIAAYTFIEHRSVQKKRSRLRKKLGLDADADLYTYFNSLDKD